MAELYQVRFRQKCVAWVMAALLCFSVVPAQAFADGSAPSRDEPVSVASEEAHAVANEMVPSPDSDETGPDTSEAEESALAPSPQSDENDASEGDAAPDADGVELLATDEKALGQQSEKPATQLTLGFVYIDETSPEVGGVQNVVFALSEESALLTEATLRYFTLQGEALVSAKRIEGNAALFEIGDLTSGEYQLLDVSYGVEGSDGLFTEDLSESGYDFDVKDPSVGVEVSALMLDDGDNLVETPETQEAIEEAIETPAKTGSARAASLSTAPAISRAASYPGLVVALDPGHGGSDSGAVGYGLKEKNLTLSIAKYCQSALQRNGITVFMTRSTDVYVGLSERVQKAVAANASVFVSLHINSVSNEDGTPYLKPNGCEVWVPNDSSYKYDTHVAGKTLGEKVIAKLAALGLTNRGVKELDSKNGTKYPDGSVADYYSVIRESRQKGIPGIIVEHAFISNPTDASKMKDEAFLKKLGEADAQGIIEAINSGIIKGTGGLYNDGKGYRFKTASGADLKDSWLTEKGHRYYFGSDGYAAKWSRQIDGDWYYFNGSCQMQTGMITWNADGLKSFYDYSTGKRRHGWLKTGGYWYYFDPITGKSSRWARQIDGDWYYFNGSCQMQTGWITWNVDGLKSYYDDSGRRQHGWRTIGGQKYYFDPATGKSSRWARQVDGDWYYFNGSGHMQTGWITWNADGLRSFYDYSTGARRHGWLKTGGLWHYLDPATGKTVRWSRQINGSWYYFNGNCQMQTGMITWSNDGLKSYYDESGKRLYGWQTVDGRKYYFSPATGKSARWLQDIDGKLYYFNGQCVLHTGWLTWVSDGTKSYCDPRDGGALATGHVSIDGVPYTFDKNGKLTLDYSYTIMGAPTVGATQMARYYRSTAGEASYPAKEYSAKGAATIDDFCKILYEEAVAEGVRPDVLFGQVMHETGWLRFGGSVQPSQCNFGGLGAVSSTAGGATFPDVRTGLRAQVQHLKAYGSTDALRNPCVDPRFSLVKRGIAPQVVDLNGRWAVPGNGYGESILSIVDRLKRS